MRVLTLFSLLLLLSAGGHSLRLSDNSGNPNSDCIKLLSQNRTPVAITSTRRSFENTLANRDFKRSLWERAIPVPLVLYGETDASWYSPSELFSTDPATLVKCNCRLNIFERQPRLQQYIANNDFRKGTGDMNAFYKRRFGNTKESRAMIRKTRFEDAGVFLVRKVAAIADALKELPDGHLLLSVDTDVVFQKQLDERFLSFAFAYDVATIAAPDSTRSYVESGIMSFVASNRTRSLVSNALALYLDGGMLALAEECGFDGGKTKETYLSNNYTCSHLGFNDVKIWHVLLGPHDDAIGKRWWNVPGLNIGWYAVGCRPNHSKWAKDAAKYSVDGDVLCPGQGNNTSPFNLFEYITHLKGGHGQLSDKVRIG
eukprot:gnl/TRDRNA2_/TRDRNA2_177645_c0_seq38.p1 gnl/TRDRNA2_/TRDRNA2_177645_c0~~gnl/TRDRNA2_/TRDRNA2_177645_c0_seq38.p1  ORF type:complete len:371 (+),score=34.24 gnl/TRDRNA2_/TRDRNA2_177645_c0_seq38:33-1145(+)